METVTVELHWRGRPHTRLPRIKVAEHRLEKPHRTLSNQAAVEVMRRPFGSALKTERGRSKSYPKDRRTKTSGVSPGYGRAKTSGTDGTTESSQRTVEPAHDTRNLRPASANSWESYDENLESYYSSSLESEDSLQSEFYAARSRRHHNTALARDFLPAVSDRLAAELPRHTIQDRESRTEEVPLSAKKGKIRFRSILKFCLPSRQENNSGPLPPAQSVAAPKRFALASDLTSEPGVKVPDPGMTVQETRQLRESLTALATPHQPRSPYPSHHPPTSSSLHGRVKARPGTPSLNKIGGVANQGRPSAARLSAIYTSKDRRHRLAVDELDWRLGTLEEASERSNSYPWMSAHGKAEGAAEKPRRVAPTIVSSDVFLDSYGQPAHQESQGAWKRRLIREQYEEAIRPPRSSDPEIEPITPPKPKAACPIACECCTSSHDINHSHKPSKMAAPRQERDKHRDSSVSAKGVAPAVTPPVLCIDFGIPLPRRVVEDEHQPGPTPSPPSTVSNIYRYYEGNDSNFPPSPSPNFSRATTRRSAAAPSHTHTPPMPISPAQSFGTFQESPSSLTPITNEESGHSPHSRNEGSTNVCYFRNGANKKVAAGEVTDEAKKKSAAASFLFRLPEGLNATSSLPQEGQPSTGSSRSAAVQFPARNNARGEGRRRGSSKKNDAMKDRETRTNEAPTTTTRRAVIKRRGARLDERENTPSSDTSQSRSVTSVPMVVEVNWTKKHVWAKAVVMREDVEREQVMQRKIEMGWD